MVLRRDLGVASMRAEPRDDRVAARDDAAGEVVDPEAGQDPLADHPAGEGVGHPAFEAIAHFDPHLMLVRRDDQQDAVVARTTSDTPGPAELHAIVLDGAALEAAQGHDHELRPDLAL